MLGDTLVILSEPKCTLQKWGKIPKRVKEWAYAGFAFDFIFATISHGAIDGINGQTFFPLVVFGILAVSYIYYHKLNTREA